MTPAQLRHAAALEAEPVDPTPAQVRAAQGRRRIVFVPLREQLDRRTPLEQWQARVARLCEQAELRAAAGRR